MFYIISLLHDPNNHIEKYTDLLVKFISEQTLFHQEMIYIIPFLAVLWFTSWLAGSIMSYRDLTSF